jgi:hypothetical protein
MTNLFKNIKFLFSFNKKFNLEMNINSYFLFLVKYNLKYNKYNHLS